MKVNYMRTPMVIDALRKPDSKSRAKALPAIGVSRLSGLASSLPDL